MKKLFFFSEKVKETISFQEKAREDLGFLVKSQGNVCEHVRIDPVSITYCKQAPPPPQERENYRVICGFLLYTTCLFDIIYRGSPIVFSKMSSCQIQQMIDSR